MSEQDNIAFFDELTGKVLACLYGAFPVPTPLLAKDFVDEPLAYSEHVMSEVASDQAEFFIATCEWLRRAGYIDADERDPYNLIVREAVLTAKGLELLKVRPQNLTDEPTLGEQLATATRDGATDAAKKTVSEVLGMGARFMMHGISSL
ncbi:MULTISPECIES: hypothetical protein [Halomonas]|uniref:Uncharacterized protein n=1 Tax=Halomonas halophila TaxID=29573 RepID=A0ABQ0U6W3_9GAMM|nr:MULTISPECIES: hypothetical protein [Halomonas]MDR5891135.1 hypothetical protein [Halomonas salina]WJY08401.1 hypothetical protein QWG60_05670 [Halomonas halophila]GEK74202.1 hypothetical protein HHA04nite_27460 [Halomonas halophila]